jgi:hypothetical protein
LQKIPLFREKLKVHHPEFINNLSIQSVARLLGDLCDSAVNNSGKRQKDKVFSSFCAMV